MMKKYVVTWQVTDRPTIVLAEGVLDAVVEAGVRVSPIEEWDDDYRKTDRYKEVVSREISKFEDGVPTLLDKTK